LFVLIKMTEILEILLVQLQRCKRQLTIFQEKANTASDTDQVRINDTSLELSKMAEQIYTTIQIMRTTDTDDASFVRARRSITRKIAEYKCFFFSRVLELFGENAVLEMQRV